MHTLCSAVVMAVALGASPAAQARQNDAERWEHVRSTYDVDGDGRVTADEYPRGERAFGHLDRDGDGVITADDFGARRSAGPRAAERRGPRAAAERLVDMYGSFVNRDGKPGICGDEWQAAIAALQPDEHGVVEPGAFSQLAGVTINQRMLRVTRVEDRVFDVDRDGELTTGDLEAMFRALDRNCDGLLAQGDEIDLPPGRGEPAPDFTLRQAGEADVEVTLSSFAGERPVALVFGSYT